MRLALLLLLITDFQATTNLILKATQNGLVINGTSNEYEAAAGSTETCKTKLIEGKWAVRAKCLEKLHTLVIKGNSAHGIRLRFWREKEDQDAEYTLAYSSEIAKSTALKIFRIVNQPKETWLNQNIYLPGLLFTEDQATLKFKSNDQAINQYQKSLTDLDSLGLSNFTDPARFNLNPFTSLKTAHKHRLFTNQNLWISNIVLFTDPYKNQEKANANFLQSIQPKYRTFLQNTDNNSLLIIISLVALGLALWAVTRYLQLQLMSSLIMPTTLIVVFMAKPMIEYFNSLEEIRLQRIQHEIKTVFNNINQARLIAMQRIHRKLILEKSQLKQAINSTNFSDQSPYILSPPNINQLSIRELRRKIKDLQQNRAQQLYNFSRENNVFRPRLKAQKELARQLPSSNLKRQQLADSYSKILYQNSLIPINLTKLEIITGLGLKVSNGKIVIEASKINSGFRNQRGLEAPLMSQLLHNLKKTPDEVSQLDREHRQAILSFRKQFNELGIQPQFISNYMNEPHNWHEIVNSRKTDTFTMNSWQIIDAKNGPWVLLMNLNLNSLTRVMEIIIKEKQLNKLVVKNDNSKKMMDGVYPGQISTSSFEYLFLGEKNRETFPIRNENSYLNRAANLAKIHQTPIFLPSINKDRSYVAMGFPLPNNPAYTIAIGREVTNDWVFLQNLKTRIQWFILFLILSPLLLATNIAGKITKPLKLLGKAVFEIARGRYSTQLQLHSMDEFSRLASQFNRMSISLQKGEELTSFIANESLQNILQKKNTSNREEVSILFCGLHNFNDYHQIDSELACQFFEKFILNCQGSIHKNGGMVDKFTGIAILAIFRGQNKEKQVVKAAQEIKITLEKVNTNSTIPFHVGIGLATGTVILGQVGANQRKDFTCIGNTVNLAARLETLSCNSNSEVTIYLDHPTLSKISEMKVITQELEPTKIKGKQKLQKVYELV